MEARATPEPYNLMSQRCSCPSRCDFRRVRKCQAAKVLGCLGCPIAGGEKCPLVGLQQLNPRSDVAGVAHVAVKTKLRTEERRAQLGDNFFGRIGALAEAMLQIAVEARLVPGPMGQFVKGRVIEVIGAFERLECRHGDEVMARHILRFAMPLPDIRAG